MKTVSTNPSTGVIVPSIIGGPTSKAKDGGIRCEMIPPSSVPKGAIFVDDGWKRRPSWVAR